MSLKGALVAAAAAFLATGTALAQGQMVPKPAMKPDSVKMEKAADTAAVKHEMAAPDLKARLDKGEKIVVIDARTSLNGQILKGAIHVPVASIGEWAKDKSKDTVVVTYCTCPHDEAAKSEVEHLRAMGFTEAYTLAGGLSAAQTAGIEVVAPAE
jgi:rhodanese-related sulfurtransferase